MRVKMEAGRGGVGVFFALLEITFGARIHASRQPSGGWMDEQAIQMKCN